MRAVAAIIYTKIILSCINSENNVVAFEKNGKTCVIHFKQYEYQRTKSDEFSIPGVSFIYLAPREVVEYL